VNLARQFPAAASHLTEFRPPSPALAIVAGVCPLNPFGGGKSSGLDASSAASTQTSDQKTTASEGSLAVGPGGKFLEGTDLSGASLKDITIQTSDSGAIAGALQTVGDVNTALSNFVNNANAAAITRQKSTDELLQGVLDKLTAQATGTQTGFQSLLISPLFWLGMAGLAVLGIFLWRKAR
jgi:hypothetical protein